MPITAASLLLWNTVTSDPDRGNVTLSGVYTDIAATRFPTPPRDVCVYAQLHGQPAEQFTLLLTCRAAGTELECGSIAGSTALGDRGKRHLSLRFNGLQFPDPGKYIFDLQVNGVTVAEYNIRVPHLASHVLGRMVRRLSADWEQLYRHPIHFVETFVDPTRHAGSCYRATNWIVLGETFGRGHRCPTSRPNRPVKLVLGYPLVKRFRELLAEQRTEFTEVERHEARSGSHRIG